jgi:hypothetical protein
LTVPIFLFSDWWTINFGADYSVCLYDAIENKRKIVGWYKTKIKLKNVKSITAHRIIVETCGICRFENLRIFKSLNGLLSVRALCKPMALMLNDGKFGYHGPMIG